MLVKKWTAIPKRYNFFGEKIGERWTLQRSVDMQSVPARQLNLFYLF